MASVSDVGKWILVILKWVLVVPSVLFLALVVDALLAFPPQAIGYYFYPPSAQSDCERMQVGMTLVEVQTVIHEAMEPFDQYYGSDRAEFFRADASCVVEFDPSTLRVRRAYLEKYGVSLVP